MNFLMLILVLLFCALYIVKNRRTNNYFSILVITGIAVTTHLFFPAWGIIWIDALILSSIILIFGERWGHNPQMSLIFRIIYKDEVDRFHVNGDKIDKKMRKTSKTIEFLRSLDAFLISLGIVISSVLFINNGGNWIIIAIPGFASAIFCLISIKRFLDEL